MAAEECTLLMTNYYNVRYSRSHKLAHKKAVQQASLRHSRMHALQRCCTTSAASAQLLPIYFQR